MTEPDPSSGAREVAEQLARVVARASARGSLPAGFVDRLLSSPDHDGALAILLEVSETSGSPLAPEVVHDLAEGLLTSVQKVRSSRAVAPLLEVLLRHPEMAAELMARDEVLHAVVGGPRRPRVERAVARVLQRVAPLRRPETVAAVVRRLGDEDVSLERLGRAAAALLAESFDGIAGLVLGADAWLPLDRDDLDLALARLRRDQVVASRLSTRCAEHGRARMLVALTFDPDDIEPALQDAVDVFAALAPVTGTPPPERRAFLRVVTDLMRLTALQLMLLERPDLVPAAVAGCWPEDAAGHRTPVGKMGRADSAQVLAALDRQGMLVVSTR